MSQKKVQCFGQKTTHKDDIVWDIGANVGAYSLLIAKKVATNGGHILAFEPESSNSHSLNRNIQLNDLCHWLTPIPLAFGNSLKLGEFFLSPNETGSATHGLDAPVSDGKVFNPSHRQGILAIR